MSSKKVFVNLTYTSSGAEPPIFLAGSFSEPAWEPQEMDCTTDENGECHFHKEVEVDEGGSYQYKFRIGVGDWWALNEQAPTVTDELGNRNNLLSVPTAEEIVQKSQASEPTSTAPKSDMPIPEVVVEKVDEEPRDDFVSDATTGQNDALDMRALDAEPDHVVNRSQTSTPVYANTAAEVADSAAILDREPSPAPVSDEEAGRTGERRMSTTPIPEVALTAAEVADIAELLDQDDEPDEKRINIPHIHDPYDTPSGSNTPWHERAPLFAHELVGPHDAEMESPITSEGVDSPTKPEPEEVIDMNDPTLERFPEDRLSILTHIRSCESRMSEDETNIQGVPPSPIARAKSRSPSIDAPGSARLDAQPSPALDVITEEHQEEDDYFNGLPGPIQKLQNVEGRQHEELNVIREAEEPADDPKTVLENLKEIEESTAKSDAVEGFAKPEADGIALHETRLAKEHDRVDVGKEQAKDEDKLMASLNPGLMGNPLNSQPGPTSGEIKSELNNQEVSRDENSDVEKVNLPEETVSDASAHPTADPVEPVEPVIEAFEYNQDDFSGQRVQLYPHNGFKPEVHNDPNEDFKDKVAVNDGQHKVEGRNQLIRDGKFEQTEHHNNKPEEAALFSDVIIPEFNPSLVNNQDKVPENEDPNDDMNAIVPGVGNVTLEEHNRHLQPMEVGRIPENGQFMQEFTQNSGPQERGNVLPDHVDTVSIGGATKDLAVSTNEDRGVAEVSTIQGSTADQVALEGEAHKSAVFEDPHTELDQMHGNDLPESKVDEVPLATQHEEPGSESQVENTSIEDKSATLDTSEKVVETSHEEQLPTSPAKVDKGPLPEQDAPVLDSQVGNASTELDKSAITTGSSQTGPNTGEVDLPVLPVKTDEVPLITKHEELGSSIQAENASTEAIKSVTTFENSQTGLDKQGTYLPLLRKDADDSLLALDHKELGLAMSKSAIHVDRPFAHKVDLPISPMKDNEQDSEMPAKQILNSDENKSATVEDTQAEVETGGAVLPMPQLTLDDAMLIARHVTSGTSDAHCVDGVDSKLTNDVDGAKSTSVDASSQNEHDNDAKLGPRKTTPPNIERQLTPDSMRSAMKASESENKKSIWGWLGGLIASLCGGERGPLLAISAVVILGPLLAMYFSRSDVL